MHTLLYLLLGAMSDAGTPDAGATPPAPITASKRWSTRLEGVGTSSPRTVDLNGDGVLDVVLAGGVQGKAGWLYALNGATGAVLWKTRFAEEIYATPTSSDANKDGIVDFFIGGRDFDWWAVSGKDGKKLWSMRAANPGAEIPKRNFNGALVVPDQDGDGLDDLLVSQGGSYDDSKRIPGRLFVVSAGSGKLLANVETPDGSETYSLPALVSPTPLEIILGTGGETLGGHLSRLAPMAAKPSPRWAVETGSEGAVASPLLTPVDGVVSVFEVFHQARVVRVDAETGEVRWSVDRPGFEARASPAPGRFGGAGAVDVVACLSKGHFPVYNSTNVIAWFDGRTGALLDEAASGVVSVSSPVVADFDDDGLDETIGFSMNSLSAIETSVTSTLTIYDGHRGKAKRLELKLRGAAQATPALADLDGDQKLDLIVSYSGLVERYVLTATGAARVAPRVRWGGFRGPSFNGVDAATGVDPKP